MKTIKIFVASSDELKAERMELADMVGQLNYTLNKMDMNILLVKWEYLDASMNPKHKQEEYNDELRECEICMVLYWTKFGMYTKAELDTAYGALKGGRNPRKLYVYFKDSDAEMTPELRAFRDSFPNEYGHFHCVFRNEDALKSHFLLQFIDYQNALLKGSGMVELRDSKVLVGGRPFADLNNVSFVGNNEVYQRLLKQIRTTRRLLAVTETSDPEYSEMAQELQDLLKRQQEMEDSLWETALTITRLSNTARSERLQRAIDLFEKGDNAGANAILDEEAIEKDVARNLELVELGQEGLKNNIAEFELKINILNNEHSEGWGEKAMAIHERILELTEKAYGHYSEEHAGALGKAGLFFTDWGKLEKALEFQKEALQIRTRLFGDNHPDIALSYNNIGCVYSNQCNLEEALEYYTKAMRIWLGLYGEHHPDVATGYNNIGYVYSNQGNLEEALEYHTKALQIRLGLYGETYPDVALSYNNIGYVYANQGKLEEAVEHFTKALRIRLNLYGENHPDVATSYNTIVR